MSTFSYYDDGPNVKKLVKYGREMITLAEENKLFPKDDEMWNAAVTCGNKLTSFGSTWSNFKSINDLSVNEKKAFLHYLETKA